jgi:hypothetical protein
MNSTLQDNETDFFQELFEAKTSKTIFMTTSILLMLTGSVLAYSIIWYERFGSDSKRTILNQLSSLQCWTEVEFILFVTLLEWVRYITGPMPVFPCWFHMVIKNGLIAKLLFLQTGLIISRYACIFWLKNPSAFNDEFWCHFINCWVNIFSFWPHFVFVFLPGREPMSYYVCVGRDPAEDDKLPTKLNITHYIVGYSSLAIHILMSLRIFWYKNKLKRSVGIAGLDQKKLFLKTFEKNSLSNFTTLTCSLILTIAFGFLFLKYTQTEPQNFNKFPDYVLVYWIQLINAPLMINLLIILSYIKSKTMRTVMIRETKEFFSNLTCSTS